MPAGSQNFCEHYRADSNVPAWIENPASGPAELEDFLGRYKAWIDDGRNTDLIEMIIRFGPWYDAEKALNAGDSQADRTKGAVLPDDCTAFNDFVASKDAFRYSAEEIAALRANNSLLNANDPVNLAFESALRKYFRGDYAELTELEEATLNGALFVQVNLSSAINSTDPSDQQLFVIPGYAYYHRYRRSLNDPLWAGINTILNGAFDNIGSRLINVRGAAQLRLGGEGETFGPIDLGPGFVIRGRV